MNVHWPFQPDTETKAMVWEPPNSLFSISHDVTGTITLHCGGDRGAVREFRFPGTLDDAKFIAESLTLGAPFPRPTRKGA